MKKILAIILAVITLLSSSVPAFAATSGMEKKVVRLTTEDLAENPALAIENLLKETKDNKKLELTIVVPEGRYVLTQPLHIYNNTKLVFEGDTFLIRKFNVGCMLKCGTENDVSIGYNGYQNITVIGGIWDNKFTERTGIMRFAHCKNVLLKNMTIKNDRNSHHMEIAGVYNFTLDNVTFSGYQRTINSSGETVQIDPLHHPEHFKAYQLLDDTPSKNITVKNCTFKNVFSGVGSRAGVAGSYFSNIKIINNKFYNIRDKAICTFNYVNSEISGNVINGASVGIFVEEFPTVHYSSKFYMPYDKRRSEIKIRTDIKLKITGNKITVNRNAGYAQSCGIGVYGGVMSGSSYYKNGAYIVNNIKISKNRITLKHPAAYGIDLQYVNKSTVSDNIINEKSSAYSYVSGISFYHGKKNKVFRNRVNGKLQFGIKLKDHSSMSKFYSNRISGVKQCGLAIYSGSKLYVGTSNYYCGTAAISDKVFKKPIMKCKLKYTRKKKLTVIEWDKCNNASGYYVYRKTSKNGKYKLIKTIRDKEKTKFSEKTKNRCYYHIVPYKTYKNSTLVGRRVTKK